MKKRTKILCLALCGALALGGGVVAVSGIQSADANTQLIIPTEYAFAEEYSYGQTLVVPAPEKVGIKTGDMETTAVDVVLTFPDGNAKGAGSYALNQTGTYVLTYYDANGASGFEHFRPHGNRFTFRISPL